MNKLQQNGQVRMQKCWPQGDRGLTFRELRVLQWIEENNRIFGRRPPGMSWHNGALDLHTEAESDHTLSRRGGDNHISGVGLTTAPRRLPSNILEARNCLFNEFTPVLLYSTLSSRQESTSSVGSGGLFSLYSTKSDSSLSLVNTERSAHYSGDKSGSSEDEPSSRIFPTPDYNSNDQYSNSSIRLKSYASSTKLSTRCDNGNNNLCGEDAHTHSFEPVGMKPHWMEISERRGNSRQSHARIASTGKDGFLKTPLPPITKAATPNHIAKASVSPRMNVGFPDNGDSAVTRPCPSEGFLTNSVPSPVWIPRLPLIDNELASTRPEPKKKIPGVAFSKQRCAVSTISRAASDFNRIDTAIGTSSRKEFNKLKPLPPIKRKQSVLTLDDAKLQTCQSDADLDGFRSQIPPSTWASEDDSDSRVLSHSSDDAMDPDNSGQIEACGFEYTCAPLIDDGKTEAELSDRPSGHQDGSGSSFGQGGTGMTGESLQPQKPDDITNSVHGTVAEEKSFIREMTRILRKRIQQRESQAEGSDGKREKRHKVIVGGKLDGNDLEEVLENSAKNITRNISPRKRRDRVTDHADWQYVNMCSTDCCQQTDSANAGYSEYGGPESPLPQVDENKQSPAESPSHQVEKLFLKNNIVYEGTGNSVNSNSRFRVPPCRRLRTGKSLSHGRRRSMTVTKEPFPLLSQGNDSRTETEKCFDEIPHDIDSHEPNDAVRLEHSPHQNLSKMVYKTSNTEQEVSRQYDSGRSVKRNTTEVFVKGHGNACHTDAMGSSRPRKQLQSDPHSVYCRSSLNIQGVETDPPKQQTSKLAKFLEDFKKSIGKRKEVPLKRKPFAWDPNGNARKQNSEKISRSVTRRHVKCSEKSGQEVHTEQCAKTKTSPADNRLSNFQKEFNMSMQGKKRATKVTVSKVCPKTGNVTERFNCRKDIPRCLLGGQDGSPRTKIPVPVRMVRRSGSTRPWPVISEEYDRRAVIPQRIRGPTESSPASRIPLPAWMHIRIHKITTADHKFNKPLKTNKIRL